LSSSLPLPFHGATAFSQNLNPYPVAGAETIHLELKLTSVQLLVAAEYLPPRASTWD
jgi:hypothetical protein